MSDYNEGREPSIGDTVETEDGQVGTLLGFGYGRAAIQVQATRQLADVPMDAVRKADPAAAPAGSAPHLVTTHDIDALEQGLVTGPLFDASINEIRAHKEAVVRRAAAAPHLAHTVREQSARLDQLRKKVATAMIDGTYLDPFEIAELVGIGGAPDGSGMKVQIEGSRCDTCNGPVIGHPYRCPVA